MWMLIQKLQKIPMYQILLYGKMIHSSISITYIYARTPNSNKKVLLELHTSHIGGNSRFLKTYHRVKNECFSEVLKSNVQRFVAECLVFQQNNVEIIKTLGLLQPLDILLSIRRKFEWIFITGLPKS